MAIANAADVLFTALEDYNPKLQELFWVKHPLFESIFTKKQFEQHKLEGTHRTFGTYVQGPGQATKLVTGNETINGGRRELGTKGNEYTTRVIYSFDVPNGELDAVNGKMDIVKMLEKYPEAGMDDFMLNISRQVARGGNTDGYDGFVTMNGATSYSPQGTNRTGVFSYDAPASQTSTVFGIAKQGNASGIAGWYNQYQNISAFSHDGLRKLRQVYLAASRQGKSNSIIDMMFADEGTYLNYLDTLSDYVRSPVGIQDDVVNAKTVRECVMFHQAKFYLEADIDLNDAIFAGTPAASGLVYAINSDTWELFYYTANKQEEGGSGKPNLFRPRNPFRIPDKDQTRFELVLDANIDCIDLRENGCITGGAA